MKIYKLEANGRRYEYWYDPAYRCWFAAEITDDQGTLGASFNAYRKEYIVDAIKKGFADHDRSYLGHF